MKLIIVLLFILSPSIARAIQLKPGTYEFTGSVNKAERYLGYTLDRNWTDPKVTLTLQIFFSTDGSTWLTKPKCATVIKGGPVLKFLGQDYFTAGISGCTIPAGTVSVKGVAIVAGGTVDVTINRK